MAALVLAVEHFTADDGKVSANEVVLRSRAWARTHLPICALAIAIRAGVQQATALLDGHNTDQKKWQLRNCWSSCGSQPFSLRAVPFDPLLVVMFVAQENSY